MNRILSIIIYQIHRVWFALLRKSKNYFHQRVSVGYCLAHQVKFNPEKIHFYGKTDMFFHPGSKVTIGDGFICRSGRTSGTIDHHVMSVIEVRPGATLSIGSHSGISNTCIHCHQSITIGEYVNIGAGTMIFDTDFHSLDWKDRKEGTDIANRKCKPVVIKDFAFIGANCLILKGSSIGIHSVVGAGSVVCCDIPDNEIWAGNPAVFIKKADINTKQP